GILAARMLSIQNPSLVEKLNHYESSLIQKVEDMQNELQ
ncbi:5-(carboxyamino)imidazole ribonucleotide mutase, partial [Staphylococcus aureus]|nr:5-(carboxyamino)imidazole ribonucleotide mutase [Staphylococcus aureus]